MDPTLPLVDLVRRLREPGGCPWDQAQTPASVRRFVQEEAHEVVEAIDLGDDGALHKELGDLLFLVVLLSRMAEERGAFSFADVAGAVHAKMIRRHPHVFGGADPGEPGLRRWEALKAQERPASASALEGIPRALPALLRAHRVGEKAAGVGFDWTEVAGVRSKVDEELAELDVALSAGDPAAIEHEFGDVLLSLASLGRHIPGTGAEDALRAAVDRFEGRFRTMEGHAAAEGASLRDLSPDALEALWARAKQEGA
jgi:MazG family protein